MSTSTGMEKRGSELEGPKLLLCENPLPPLDEAIDATRAELAHGNYYTEAFTSNIDRVSPPMREAPDDQPSI